MHSFKKTTIVALSTLLLAPASYAMTKAAVEATSNSAIVSQSSSGVSSDTQKSDSSLEQKFMVVTHRLNLVTEDTPKEAEDEIPALEDGEASSEQANPLSVILSYGSLEAFSGECVLTLNERINAFSIIADKGKLIAGCAAHTVKVWEIANNTVDKAPLVFKNRKSCTTTMTVLRPSDRYTENLKDPACTLIATGSPYGIIMLWRLKGTKFDLCRKLTYEELSDHLSNKAVITLASMDGGLLASLHSNGVIVIWDVPEHRMVRKLQEEKNPALAITALDDGILAAGFNDHTIKLFNPTTNAYTATLNGHTGPVRSLYALPGGFLISGSDDTTVKIWNPKSEYPCVHTLRGHTASITAITYIPSKGLIASGDEKGYVKVWDIAAANNPCICTKETKAPIATLSTYNDHLCVTTAAKDGISFWR